MVSLFGDRLKKLYKPGSQNTALPTCFDLKMHPANINHQMHLNQFGLEFEDYARGDAAYTYYDEKFMPPASDFIMPDGMIVLPERILFLEMDMGTERVKRLAQKWNSYRMFLNSPKAFYEKKPITMFFLLAGVKRLSYRQKSVMRSLMTYLNGRVNGEFEAYIETPEMCHEILQTRYLSAGTEMAGAEKSVLDCLRAKYGFTLTHKEKSMLLVLVRRNLFWICGWIDVFLCFRISPTLNGMRKSCEKGLVVKSHIYW